MIIETVNTDYLSICYTATDWDNYKVHFSITLGHLQLNCMLPIDNDGVISENKPRITTLQALRDDSSVCELLTEDITGHTLELAKSITLQPWEIESLERDVRKSMMKTEVF